MKRFGAVATVVLAAVVLGFGGAAQAAGTATVDVTATVLAQCNFSTDGTMAFGNLPIVPADTAGAVTQPTFACTNGTDYTITDDGGLAGTYTMDSGTDTINYTFTYTATGTGNGALQSMDIAGMVTAAAYTGALAGVYTDTVTLTINP